MMQHDATARKIAFTNCRVPFFEVMVPVQISVKSYRNPATIRLVDYHRHHSHKEGGQLAKLAGMNAKNISQSPKSVYNYCLLLLFLFG